MTAFETAETLAALCGVSAAAMGSTDQIQEAVRKETSQLVDEVCDEAAGGLGHLPAVTVTAVGGGAAEVLIHAARNAELLVVGSRGRGGFASMVLGSVGLQCVLHSSCPVTVVHPPTVSGIETVTS